MQEAAVCETTGIDVSHFQGKIDWARVRKAGHSFAVVRATQGIQTKDTEFQESWKQIPAVGLMRGAYHLFSVGKDAEKQARNYIETVGTFETNDLPPVLDLSDMVGMENSKMKPQDLWSEAALWLRFVEIASGMSPIVYTDPIFWERYMNSGFGRYPLWISHPHVEDPLLPSGWQKYTFWQYENRGKVTGVAPHITVNVNLFNGTEEELHRFIAQAHIHHRHEVAHARTHTVKAGESLIAIARMYGVMVEELAAVNFLKPNTIVEAGQVLELPH